MLKILKPVLTIIIVLIVLFFLTTLLLITTQFPMWLCISFASIAAMVAGRFVWKLIGGEKTSVSVAVLGGAFILGGIGFIIGFLGLMIFTKETSQSPLIAIFITGPLGMILGAIAGYVYVSRQYVRVNN